MSRVFRIIVTRKNNSSRVSLFIGMPARIHPLYWHIRFPLALKDPVVWCYLLMQLSSFIIVGGLAVFANIIVKGLGFTTYQTQLLNLAQGGWSVLIYICSAWLARLTNQTILVGIVFMSQWIPKIPYQKKWNMEIDLMILSCGYGWYDRSRHCRRHQQDSSRAPYRLL